MRIDLRTMRATERMATERMATERMATERMATERMATETRYFSTNRTLTSNLDLRAVGHAPRAPAEITSNDARTVGDHEQRRAHRRRSRRNDARTVGSRAARAATTEPIGARLTAKPLFFR